MSEEWYKYMSRMVAKIQLQNGGFIGECNINLTVQIFYFFPLTYYKHFICISSSESFLTEDPVILEII